MICTLHTVLPIICTPQDILVGPTSNLVRKICIFQICVCILTRYCDTLLQLDDDLVRAVKLTSRERRFIKFASVEYDGQLYMTPQDFLESVVEQEPRRELRYTGNRMLSSGMLVLWEVSYISVQQALVTNSLLNIMQSSQGNSAIPIIQQICAVCKGF